MSMERYRPSGGPMSLRDMMNRLFEESFVQPRSFFANIESQFPLELCEMNDEFLVRMALPGVRPEDVDITLVQDTLTIKGELRPPEFMQQQMQRTQQQPQGTQQTPPTQQQTGQTQGQRAGRTECLFSEIQYGTFVRRVTFPTMVDADKADARFENGMLILHLPKAAEAKPKRLQVTTGTGTTRSQGMNR